MKSFSSRLITALVWIALATVAATVYGVVNDQLTVSLSPEYFSVFKRAQFADLLEATSLTRAAPRVQSVLVGAAATWWFGLLLGVVLSIAGLAGQRSALRTSDFVRAIAGIMAFSLGVSAIMGAAAYLAEPAVHPTVSEWPFLDGIQGVRRAFAVGWWHNGAYLGGLVGTVAAAWAVRRRRSVTEGRD